MEKQHTELMLSDLKDSPTLYPVFNRKNELSNIICILGKEQIVTKITKRAEDRVKQTSRVPDLVRKVFRSRRKGQRE